MTSRHVTTALTLVVLCVILAVGAIVGFKSLFAPLPGSEEQPDTATPSASCDPSGGKKRVRLRSSEITVNVFNGGDRAGLAGSTLDGFRARGFVGGEIGNAPTDSDVRRAQVWIEDGEEAAGRLVARQLGPRVPVITPDEDLADGVDVVVGDGFRSLVRAPRSIVVKGGQTTGC